MSLAKSHGSCPAKKANLWFAECEKTHTIGIDVQFRKVPPAGLLLRGHIFGNIPLAPVNAQKKVLKCNM